MQLCQGIFRMRELALFVLKNIIDTITKVFIAIELGRFVLSIVEFVKDWAKFRVLAFGCKVATFIRPETNNACSFKVFKLLHTHPPLASLLRV